MYTLAAHQDPLGNRIQRLLLCIKLPYNCLLVFAGQEPGFGLSGSFGLICRPGGEDLIPDSPAWLPARFSSLWAVGLRVSVPCWLLSKGHISSLPVGFSSLADCFIKSCEPRRESRENARWKSGFFIN